MRVAVSEEARLEHPVGRGADAGHEVRGIERRLLDLREVVVGHPVQHQLGDRDERVVAVVPDLGEVERIDAVVRARRPPA